METAKSSRVGDILLKLNYITQDELDLALEKQKTSRRRLGAILMEQGVISLEQLLSALNQQGSGYDLDLEQIYIPPEIPLLISEKLARRHTIIPIKLEDDLMTLAMENPTNMFAVDDVKLATGLRVKPVGAPAAQIHRAIGIYYEKARQKKR